MIEPVIYDLLSTDADLTDLVGNRIYPSHPAKDTDLPYLVYYVSDTQSNRTIDGVDGPVMYEVVVEARALEELTRSAINLITASILDGLQTDDIQGMFLDNTLSLQAERGYANQQTYSLWF